MGIFGKKKEPEETAMVEVAPQEAAIQDPGNLTQIMRDDVLDALANKVGIKINAERSESHEYREEIIPPVITIGTDLDREDELSHEIRTKTDKWGFHIDYQGTKGRIFDTEVPRFQFGHLSAMLPQIKNHVYKMTYDIDKNGNVKRDHEGKPIILKKERVHMGIDLSNMKARLNLAENGYARNQQKDVIIGGIGQVDPYTGDRMKEALQFAFGKAKR